jgi:ABC-type transporter Mla subunit MlaD
MGVSLVSGIDAVKSGVGFKGPPEGVAQLGTLGLNSATDAASSITSAYGSASSTLSTSLSVSKSQVNLIELKAKSEGREPTPEELDEACGPLSFLAKAGNELTEALGGIFDSVNKFASDFGESIGAFAAKLNKLIDDVANAVDEIVKEIAEQALALFETANNLAIQALNAVENAINTAVGFVNDALAEADRLLNKAIDELLAFADSLNFASLFNLDCQEEAVENALDKDKIADADEVSRVLTPEAVDGTDETITSETLPVPQTSFETPESKPPSPSLNQLIERYRTAARALNAGRERIPIISRTERAALERASNDAFQDLRVAALAEGKIVGELPVWGENFDKPLPPVSASRGTDAAKPKTSATAPSVQNEADSIKADIARFNRLNQEQGSEGSSLKREVLFTFTAEGKADLTRRVNANLEKRAEASRLSKQIGDRIRDASPEVKRAVGSFNGSLRPGYFQGGLFS